MNLREREIDIETADGAMPTLIVHSALDRPHPVVLMLMDGLGIRPALQDQARRLAGWGYYVMLPNLYYRAGPQEPVDRTDPEGWDRMMKLVASVTDARAVRDAQAALDFAADDPAAGNGPAGIMGYCMGGRLSVVLAQGLGARVAAAGGVHPGNLASDTDDSPHRHLDQVKAEIYLGIADNDDYCTPDQVALMEDGLKAAGVTHQVEWHRGALHGFGVPGSEVYDEAAAELVWERLRALFERNLK